ncbi:abnormal spindle-like microcephaly-associated protein homolog [Pollicipes pollicipes]|uniref:abnormal spindle-like microcephaly-associated protein homolog n=1 Tax=Pollicipes pollicipes TaxID=41117 RepID=UPI0018857F05|nr:abnormal spindle-like microcephaly-associated protein homolog [Pollicipes pollicipes]
MTRTTPEPVPVLQLRRFAATPKVAFGTVRVGSSRTIGLIVQNPSEQPVQLIVEKVPEALGFRVDVPVLHLEPLMDAVLAVHWTPAAGGNQRGVLALRTDGGVRCQAVLLGTGRAPDTKKKKTSSAKGPRFLKPQSRNAGTSTSTDCSTLLDALRTPPDFSVSLIRSEPAPAPPPATPRRHTFLAEPPAAKEERHERHGARGDRDVAQNAEEQCAAVHVETSEQDHDWMSTPALFGKRFGGRHPGGGLSCIREESGSVASSGRNLTFSLEETPLEHAEQAEPNCTTTRTWLPKAGARPFTAWLNFILTPSEYSCDDVKVDAARILLEAKRTRVPPAPSRETLSLREYTAQRRLNRLRMDACRLFEEPQMTRVIRNVEREVETGGLRVRRDRTLHADVGLKQLVVGWLLNYNPLWLRLGLETVYGEVIHLQAPDDLTTLARFITTRLLWSPELAARHRHPTVPHLYGPQWEPELKRFILKKFLLLVLLLDVAKSRRLIHHDPCLFNKRGHIKASRELLVAFSREMLAGEGDITKHLAFHGYRVSHQQTALHEFDYAVTCLATDLRCGVRLTRVVELLRQRFDLSAQLRLPALDRQQKLHNSRLAVAAAELQLDAEPWARHLVDGHCERTLHLLWLLALRYQITVGLDLDKLRREVARLEKSLSNSCFIGNAEAEQGRLLLEQLPAERRR